MASVMLIAMWVASYGKKHRSYHLGNTGWKSERGVVLVWRPFGALFDETQARNNQTINESLMPVSGPIEIAWRVDIFGLRFFGPGEVWWLEVPYWLAVLPTGAFATAPWIRWSRRFSVGAGDLHDARMTAV